MEKSSIVFTKKRKNTKRSIEKLEVDEQNVTIQSRTGGSVVINFKGSQAELLDISKFFNGIDDVEPLALNIAGSGDVDHYFRGMSDVSAGDDGLFNLSVTLQFLTTTL
ncbi:MAG: hypothetical protein PHY59_00325 [Methanobacterium sp.]|nr:hypothetical protein [Methanobacterium sp.]